MVMLALEAQDDSYIDEGLARDRTGVDDLESELALYERHVVVWRDKES